MITHFIIIVHNKIGSINILKLRGVVIRHMMPYHRSFLDKCVGICICITLSIFIFNHFKIQIQPNSNF